MSSIVSEANELLKPRFPNCRHQKRLGQLSRTRSTRRVVDANLEVNQGIGDYALIEDWKRGLRKTLLRTSLVLPKQCFVYSGTL
jgi:hypothetical protein